jgi:hypothetical protein
MADKSGLKMIGVALAALTAGTMTIAGVIAYQTVMSALTIKESTLLVVATLV